jgi:hypothetical protein
MNPSLRNLFMNKFTRDLVVPIISASVLAYLRYDRLRLTLLPEIRHQEENSCQTFFARIEELVDQVLLKRGSSELIGTT